MVEIRNDQELDAFMADPARVTAALRLAGQRLGLGGRLHRFARGSVPVGAFGDVVVKLFPAYDAPHADIEHAALAGLAGRLSVATPLPLDRGHLAGWTYLVMGRLEGVELAERWPALTLGEQQDLGAQVGAMLRELNALSAPPAIPRVDWTAYVAERSRGAVDRQRACRATERLVAQIPDFLAAADLAPGTQGWLHTEVMLEHLLVARRGQGWRLTGLFDFEPSWVGPVDYELSSVGLFVARGDRHVFRAVLGGLGRTVDPHRVMAMALVHRYSNLAWYCRRLGAPADATLGELAEAWFGA